MPMQRFRSNSSSSILDSPLSPTYSSSNTTPSNDTYFSSTRCEPINVPVLTTLTRPHDRTFHETNPTSSGPRLSLSPIGGAAGVMKKLLGRKRGNTNSSDGVVIGGGAGIGRGEGGPSSPTAAQSFVIVGGQGGIAAGATVYDLDSFHSLSPPSALSPVMIPLNSPHSPTSPTSPRSPTFSQSMFTRITGREYRASPIQISAPMMTSARGRSRLASGAEEPLSGSLTLSAVSTRKKLNRRSLSADSLWTTKGGKPELGRSNGSDGPIRITPRQWHQESTEANEQPIHRQVQGIEESELEFYKNSVLFLNTHHSRNNTADNWSSRNKRKTGLPMRRQSESSLLSKILEVTDEVASIKDDSATSAELDEDEDSNPFGPGSCWKDMDPSCSPDFDVDGEYRSLLSSVDIMLVPTISSPTKYYDCPKTRQIVRSFMTAGQREFDEIVEFGFPSNAVLDDRDGKVKDCRFMTLRLTLTPWHARADESKLYGPGDAEKHMPLKEKVNKFLSRTSAMLSSSPPRPMLHVPEVKPVSSQARKSSTPDSNGPHTVVAVDAPDHGRVIAPCSSQGVHVHSLFDPTEKSTTFPTLTDAPKALSASVPLTASQSMNNTPPKIPPKNRTAAPRKDKGFRITDPTTAAPLAPSTIRSARSAELLNRDPEPCASPPLTPSPTTTHPYGQQHQQPPRKGSLSALSLPMNTHHGASSTSTLPEDIMLVPPMVPPRRKASSPAILLSDTEAQRYQHLHQSETTTLTTARPNGAIAVAPLFTTATKAQATQSPTPSHAHFQPSQAVVTPTIMNGTAATTISTLPIPIPSTNRQAHLQHQYQQQQYQQQLYYTALVTDSDIYGAPAARTPRAPSRKKLDHQVENVSVNARSMPRYETTTTAPMMTTTSAPSTITQERSPSMQPLQYHQHQQPIPPLNQRTTHSNPKMALDTHKMYIPRTQYTPPVNSH